MFPLFGGGEEHLVLTIDDATQVAEARRRASHLAERLGFDSQQAGRVALVVTEAATNLLKHAERGELLVRRLARAGGVGLEVLALDRGQGIPNVSEALRDGFSTAGSAGTGLGAIRRLAAEFDVYSVVGGGTAVLAWLWTSPPTSDGARIDVGAVCVPMPGEELCGDAWAVQESSGRLITLVVDGLGHGAVAAEASREALRVFRRQPSLPPGAMIEAIHGALRSTRGAAAAVAEVDLASAIVRWASIGNITGVIVADGDVRHLVSQNGIVGHGMRKLTEMTYPWPPNALLVQHSDGIGTRWDIERYPGLAARHPALVAGVLYRDFRRERDDATALVIRERRA